MRRLPSLWLAAALFAACSPVEMEMGNGGTVVPNATPNPAQFPAVQAALVASNCGNGVACHAAPGQSGLVLVTTSTATPAQIADNARELSCEQEVTTYDPPAGTITEYFCNTSTTALPIGTVGQGPPANQHQSGAMPGFDDDDCTALHVWLESGSGNPPPCQ